MSALVDTGGLVAFADRRDRFHFVFRRFFEEHAQHETLIVPITVPTASLMSGLGYPVVSG
jgi:hypothetical protein